MNKYIKLIKNISLFNLLSHEEISDNLNEGFFKVVSYMKNSIMHFEGEECIKFELILSGKVIVDSINEQGNLLNVSEFYSGDILGGNLLFSKNPYYPMTISTQEPSLILEIDKEILFKIFSTNLDFLKTYLQYISDNAHILGSKIKHYANKTIREKIINYLEYESKRQDTNHIILNITKTALAEKFGVQRTSLSRELSKMREDRLILFDAESITILDNFIY